VTLGVFDVLDYAPDSLVRSRTSSVRYQTQEQKRLEPGAPRPIDLMTAASSAGRNDKPPRS
jgi:hypothetical protein